MQASVEGLVPSNRSRAEEALGGTPERPDLFVRANDPSWPKASTAHPQAPSTPTFQASRAPAAVTGLVKNCTHSAGPWAV